MLQYRRTENIIQSVKEKTNEMHRLNYMLPERTLQVVFVIIHVSVYFEFLLEVNITEKH